MKDKKLMLSSAYANQLGFDINNKIKNGIYDRKTKKMNWFYNFTLPSAITCPSAPNICKDICIAKRSENLYKDKTMLKRQKNYDLSQKDIFVNNMVQEIYEIYKNHKNVGIPFEMYIRIHASGDFYSEEYFRKWLGITHVLQQYSEIKFMAYTKEIIMIEKVLNELSLTLDNVNIKIVFSEMYGYGNSGTTKDAISAYDRVVEQSKKLLSQNMISKYIVHPKNIVIENSICCNINYFHGNAKIGIVKTNTDDNIFPQYAKLYINPAAKICANCKLCYEKSLQNHTIEITQL